MPDFTSMAEAFLANSTLQDLYGYHMKGAPPDAFRYLINQKGCEALVGTGSAYYDWSDSSGTINTWVLPFTGLLLQAPFDSNDFAGTFWAIMRWTGGCMASLSYVLWNMRTTANCAAFVDKATNRDDFPKDIEEDKNGSKVQSEFSSIRDAFFLLGVMNQFTLNVRYNGISAEKLLKVALFSKELSLPSGSNASIEEVRRALARDTREARKRGTVQCFLSMLWFIFGMVISIQESFGLLGQNAPAHNLALGLCMVWFPVLMLCTVVDRNPAVPEATQRQLNRFLGMVRAALIRDAGRYRDDRPFRSRFQSFDTLVRGSPMKALPLASIASIASISSINSPLPEIEPKSAGVNWFQSSECDSQDLRWVDTIAHEALDDTDFFVHFAGQGRKIWHYGVAHPIIQGLKDDGIMDHSRGWLYDANARRKLMSTANIERKDRLHSWDMREFWQLAMATFAVWGSCISALLISYFTPTVGLGCRALGYVVFGVNCTGQMIIEMVIWWITPHHDIEKKSYQWWRTYGLWFLRFAEVANAAWLLYIVFAQALGSYNTCRCKCSNYGLGGGYINVYNILDPRPDAAKKFWIAGTTLGCSVMAICFAFIAWEWVSQSHLSTESYDNSMRGLRTTRRFKKYTKWLLPLQA